MRILRPLMLLSGLFLLACGGVVGDLSGATALQAELDQARADLQSSQDRLQSTQELADARQLEVAELQARIATCDCPEVAAAEATPAEAAPAAAAEPAKAEPAKTTTTASTTSASAAKTTTTSTTSATKTSGAATTTTTTTTPAAETSTTATTTSRAPVVTTGQIEIAADDTVRMTVDGKTVPYSKLKDAFIAKELEPGSHTVVLKSREGNVDLSRVIDVVAGKRVRYELKGSKLTSLGSVDATN